MTFKIRRLPTQTPQLSTELLSAFGWYRNSSTPGLYDVWVNEMMREREILIPTNPDRGDYDLMMSRALKALIVIHGETSIERFFLHDRNDPALDSTRWKKETSISAGLIPWSAGRALYDSAQAQLMAAAKACREPRPYHKQSGAYVAKRFLEQSYMGQTGEGSFIITAHTPVETPIYFSPGEEDRTSVRNRQPRSVSGKQILDTFEKSLFVVRESIEEYKLDGRIAVFREAFLDGVSYELTSALSHFTSESESAIELHADVQSKQVSKTVEITFDPPDSRILKEASNALVQSPPSQRLLIEGEATHFNKSQRVVQIRALPGSPVRSLHVKLDEEQYREAAYSQASDLHLRVVGSVTQEKATYWMHKPESVDAFSRTHARQSAEQSFNLDNDAAPTTGRRFFSEGGSGDWG